MGGVEARFLANPRQEAAENELDVSNRKFRALGFEPTKLNDALFEEVQDVTQKSRTAASRRKSCRPRSGTRSARRRSPRTRRRGARSTRPRRRASAARAAGSRIPP